MLFNGNSRRCRRQEAKRSGSLELFCEAFKFKRVCFAYRTDVIDGIGEERWVRMHELNLVASRKQGFTWGGFRAGSRKSPTSPPACLSPILHCKRSEPTSLLQSILLLLQTCKSL
jgi:hypothetical protein